MDDDDDKMDLEETPAERRARYMSSSQEEVSDPEERAEAHYGGLDVDNYERMVSFSRANRLRLQSALESLRMRRNIAEVVCNHSMWHTGAPRTPAEPVAATERLAFQRRWNLNLGQMAW